MNSLFKNNILPLLFFILAGGCASAQSLVEIEKSVPDLCTAQHAVDDIKISVADHSLESPVKIKYRGSEPNKLQLRGSFRLSGHCTNQIRRFSFGIIELQGGDYLILRGTAEQLKLEALKEAASVFKGELPSSLGEKAFSSDKFQFQNGMEAGHRGYVGIWDAEQSVVAAIAKNPEPNNKPIILLESQDRFVGEIAYFPSLDYESGQINVMQRELNGDLLFFVYHWVHQGLFQPTGPSG